MGAATLSLLRDVAAKFRPRPGREHYAFDLRDAWRALCGVMQADKRRAAEPVAVARLWMHENWRVFGDRLMVSEEREWLAAAMQRTVSVYYYCTSYYCYHYFDYMQRTARVLAWALCAA